ncbi:MAG: hypothetical protein AAGA25_14640 [Planctomycetota bacterium]
MPDDLNLTIRRWRDALACRESIKGEQLDELQDHLEAELQQIPAQGLSEEERVLLAARRVGSLDQLDTQFFDANPSLAWRRRVLWMVIGYFALVVLPGGLLKLAMPAAIFAVNIAAPKVLVVSGLIAMHVAVWAGLFFFLNKRMKGLAPNAKVSGWIKSYPVAMITMLIVAVLVFELALAIPMGYMLALRGTNISDFGTITLWNSFMNFTWSFLAPSGLGFLAWRCYRQPTVHS